MVLLVITLHYFVIAFWFLCYHTVFDNRIHIKFHQLKRCFVFKFQKNEIKVYDSEVEILQLSLYFCILTWKCLQCLSKIDIYDHSSKVGGFVKMKYRWKNLLRTFVVMQSNAPPWMLRAHVQLPWNSKGSSKPWTLDQQLCIGGPSSMVSCWVGGPGFSAHIISHCSLGVWFEQCCKRKHFNTKNKNA